MKDAAVRALEIGADGEGCENVGKETRFFEGEFAAYCGAKYAIFMNSSLTAGYLLLKLQGISEGDEVITSPIIEPANATMIAQTGAKPVFVDVEEDTLNMDPTKIEKKINTRTKAIHPIHAHGHPSDMDAIMELARKHDLYVLEDATHALGAKYKGRKLPVGNAGVIGLNVKCLWIPGGAAMAVTNDKGTADKLWAIRSWEGRRTPHVVKDLKGNGITFVNRTLSGDLSAAVGRVQLRHLDEYTEAQRRNASIYAELLKETPPTLPTERDYAYHCFLRYVIQSEKRDALQQYLLQQGVDCHVLYDISYHSTYYQQVYGYKKGECPVAEKVHERQLALPEPTKDRTRWEMEYVANQVKQFYV